MTTKEASELVQAAIDKLKRRGWHVMDRRSYSCLMWHDNTEWGIWIGLQDGHVSIDRI